MSEITLNGRLFVRGKAAVVDTLFRPGGTASGYYLTKGREIHVFKPCGALDGVINASGCLCKATRRDDGRTWYSYGDLETVGRWLSWSRRCDDIENARRVAFNREPVAA